MVALIGRPSRAAAGALGLGLGLALVAARLAPLPGPPLYDGAVQPEPYKWLDPAPGHPGGAQGATATVEVKGGTSPLIALATPPENSPQAQIFASPGALSMPPGTTSLSVSIQPVEPSVHPIDTHLDGNVYRVAILTQTGAAVTIQPSAQFTLVLEAPDPTTVDATIGHIAGGAWQTLKTENAGLGANFLSVITELGDFGLLQPGPAGSPAGSAVAIPSAAASVPPSNVPEPLPSGEGTGGGPAAITLYAAIAIALLLLGLLAVAIFPRRRRPRARSADRPPPRTRR